MIPRQHQAALEDLDIVGPASFEFASGKFITRKEEFFNLAAGGEDDDEHAVDY